MKINIDIHVDFSNIRIPSTAVWWGGCSKLNSIIEYYDTVFRAWLVSLSSYEKCGCVDI